MDEYIKREMALEAIDEYFRTTNPDDDEQIGVLKSRRIIRTLPAADVAPVRHGRWEWFEEWNPSTPDHPTECEDYGWRCSECKTSLDDVVGGYWDDLDDEPKLKYCPNCGAKMNEEVISGSSGD